MFQIVRSLGEFGCGDSKAADKTLADDSGDDVVIISDDSKATSLRQHSEESESAEGASEETEVIALKIENAELLKQIKKLKSQLITARKKNKEIFEFATELVLEKKKKK